MNFEEQIRCILSEEISLPCGPMLTETKKKKKNPKIQNLKFHNISATLVDTLPMSMHESDVYFQRGCRLKFLLPYGRKKNRKN